MIVHVHQFSELNRRKTEQNLSVTHSSYELNGIRELGNKLSHTTAAFT